LAYVTRGKGNGMATGYRQALVSRLEELNEERALIQRLLGTAPRVSATGRRSVSTKARRDVAHANGAGGRKRKRVVWTKAMRAATAKRMKAFWAAKKKGRG
jgi:hypothetical protein